MHQRHRSPKVLIPPRTGAQLARVSAGTRPRRRHIRARARVGQRKGYVASGDRRRRKGETTFHRDKALLGSARRARGLASQRVEVRWGGTILNTLPALGIPDGEMIGCPADGVTGDAQPAMELCTKAPGLQVLHLHTEYTPAAVPVNPDRHQHRLSLDGPV